MVDLRYAPRKKREDGWQQYSAKSRLSPDDENPDYPDTMSNVGLADVASPTFDKPERKPWLEGGKFGWRDGLGLVLGSLADGMAKERGGEGGTLDDVFKRAYAVKDMAKKAQAKAAEDAAKYQDAFASFKAAGYPDAQASAMAKGYMSPSEAKPDMFNNKAGDRVAIGPNGQARTVYTDNNPTLLNTQNSVYAMDAHTGGQFGGQQQQHTAPGTIENGYQFMGGDDADPKNWRQVEQAGGAGSQAPRSFRVPRLR